MELAGEISNTLCRQTEKDITMEYPFMIQMLGTACQVPDKKEGKMYFLLIKNKTSKQRKTELTAFCLNIGLTMYGSYFI